jgi:hypothetical protein
LTGRARIRGATLLAVVALALPARGAEISGRVVRAPGGAAAPDLEVHALGIDAQQQTLLRQTRSDAGGAFRFADLPSPAAYLLRVSVDGLAFPGPAILFRPGEPELRSDVEIPVYERSSDGRALKLEQLQWVVEHEAGVYRVQQSARVANPDPRVVLVGPQDPPLLRVALAPGHGEVQTPFGQLPEGVSLVDGVAEIRGPVFPGTDGLALELSYDLEAREGELQTELRFPDPVAELALFVEDFGVRIDAGGLHPARPARERDVFYQRFLGFDLGPDAPIRVQISPLPPASTAPPWTATLLAALLVGALVFFVGQPVTRAGAAASAEPPEPPGVRAQLEAALADLEHDFETGKLSAADRDRLREDLRSEALRALAHNRAVGARRAAAPPGAPSPERCSCGETLAAGARFCSQCGRAR